MAFLRRIHSLVSEYKLKKAFWVGFSNWCQIVRPGASSQSERLTPFGNLPNWDIKWRFFLYCNIFRWFFLYWNINWRLFLFAQRYLRWLFRLNWDIFLEGVFRLVLTRWRLRWNKNENLPGSSNGMYSYSFIGGPWTYSGGNIILAGRNWILDRISYLWSNYVKYSPTREECSKWLENHGVSCDMKWTVEVHQLNF